jgi:hypothetical protein
VLPRNENSLVQAALHIFCRRGAIAARRRCGKGRTRSLNDGDLARLPLEMAYSHPFSQLAQQMQLKDSMKVASEPSDNRL